MTVFINHRQTPTLILEHESRRFAEVLVKNRENPTEEQGKQLTDMLKASPELKQCSELKEAFRDLFNQNMTVKFD